MTVRWSYISQALYKSFGYNGESVHKNKTGTSQVGAISKSQKAQNIFLEKT